MDTKLTVKSLAEQYQEFFDEPEVARASLQFILEDKLGQKERIERDLNLLKADITMLDNLINTIKD